MFEKGIATATLCALAVLATAAPALGADTTPRSCGKTESRSYHVSVNRHTSCELAFAAYWEMVEYGNQHGFVAGVPKRFEVSVKLPSLPRAIRMTARAIPRAHGTFDFSFDNRKFGGKRLVHLDNATLP